MSVQSDFELLWRDAGKFLSNSSACMTCDLCERDNIYLLSEELSLIRARHDGYFPTVEVAGVSYIAKSTRYCPFYDVEHHRCGIYEHRPLVCRIYPLDLVLHRVSGGAEELWWVVHDVCPITREHAFRGEFGLFLQQAEELERRMTPQLGDAFRRMDHSARGLEYMFRTPLKYTPIKRFVAGAASGTGEE